MIMEGGLSIVHTTIMRWVYEKGPQLEEKVRHHLKSKMTCVGLMKLILKYKDSKIIYVVPLIQNEIPIDFYLSKPRDKQKAKCFFVRF